MDETVTSDAALAETTAFLGFFKEMPDHRQPGKVLYEMDGVDEGEAREAAMVALEKINASLR